MSLSSLTLFPSAHLALFTEMPGVTAAAVSVPNVASLEAAVNALPVNDQIDVSALFVADKATRDSAAKSVAAVAQKDGPLALQNSEFAETIVKALADKRSPAAREGAASAISLIVQAGAIKALEPTFVESSIQDSARGVR